MIVLDKTDLAIIEILRKNARTPYTEIAKTLRLSEAAIRKRIDKLIRLGVIKRFTIDVTLESEIKAIILVKVNPPTPVSEVSKKIIKFNGVDVVYEITGDYDLAVIVHSKNVLEINKYIDMIRDIKGVAGTNTMVVLKAWY